MELVFNRSHKSKNKKIKKVQLLTKLCSEQLRSCNNKMLPGMEIHLPLLKDEVETCTPGRERSINLTG